MSLPILTPTSAKIPQILSHMADCWPDDHERINEYLHARFRGDYTYAHQDVAEAETLREWLADPSWGDQTIAHVVTREICRPDNLGYVIGATAVRNHRDQMETR